MKRTYFSQKQADADDFLQKEFIRMGIVPKTCLLGGVVLEIAVREERDPCETCPGPREKCRGRPRVDRGSALDADESAVLFRDSSDVIILRQMERAREAWELLHEHLAPEEQQN